MKLIVPLTASIFGVLLSLAPANAQYDPGCEFPRLFGPECSYEGADFSRSLTPDTSSESAESSDSGDSNGSDSNGTGGSEDGGPTD